MNGPKLADDERRIATRRSVEGGSVAFCAFTDTDGATLVARVIDISLAGVLVSIPNDILKRWPPLGQALPHVSVSLDGEQIVECAGEVAWLGGAVNHGARSYRSGVAFKALSNDAVSRLKRWMHGLETQD